MNLQPGATAKVLQDSTLRFSHKNKGVEVQSMGGFVSQVEYADGGVWVPNRVNLENQTLLRVLAPSPEEQRLSDLYRKKGVSALVDELRKF